MKLGDLVRELEVDPRKLRDYALNPENPVGKDKAAIFERRLGFTRENYEGLMAQIRENAIAAEATPTHADEHGQRYRVDVEIVGIAGQRAVVRTGWIVEPGMEIARLVTLYVRKAA